MLGYVSETHRNATVQRREGADIEISKIRC
jgi:hypothetical protein